MSTREKVGGQSRASPPLQKVGRNNNNTTFL